MELDGTVHPGGGTVTLAASLDRLPLLVRAGGVLALATAWDERTPHDATAVELMGFAGTGEGVTEGRFLLDDGVSHEPGPDDVVAWRFRRGRDGCDLSFTGAPAVPVATRIVGFP